MNNLKFLLTTLIIVAFSLTGYSQTKELGLRLANLNDFTFIYKKQKADAKFIRHRLGSFNFQVTGVSGNENVSVGLGYAGGLESRKSINDKLLFIHGPELQMAANVAKTMSRTIINLRPGIGYVLGFQYNINEAFYINIETIPSITTNLSLVDERDNVYSIGAGFNSNAVALTVAYRFNNDID